MIAVAIGILLTAAVAMSVAVTPRSEVADVDDARSGQHPTDAERRVTVPAVEGMTLGQARATLHATGLSAGVGRGEGFNDPPDPEAIVAAQEPPPGAEVQTGVTVGLRTALVSPGLCEHFANVPPRRGDAHDLAREEGFWDMLEGAQAVAAPPLAEAIDDLLGHHRAGHSGLDHAATWALDRVTVHHDVCTSTR